LRSLNLSGARLPDEFYDYLGRTLFPSYLLVQTKHKPQKQKIQQN